MSKTVDSRVVEMRFDNKQFESNVSRSMSTLEKLKQKLKLSDASKGLEGLSNASKKVDFSGMGKGIDTVQAKFSALQVIGVTALANITNSAVNAGKRMASALTIEPIKSGFQEYETQIGAIQTILANTQKEGTNVATVNKALDELNLYADKTIYNFTEMTRNIGTFTAAGVKLDTSVQAIKGIANLAAVSGSTSQQASTAMYQLSQALAAGKVQLMDWNSVVNAGMGGQLFQDALIRTSELLGTGAKAAIEAEGSFRESLTKSGWLTTEVLTETLNQLAGAYDKAELMAQGFTEEQADEIVKLAETAVNAATEVKTFTQLWDTLKEAAQSGWSQTWRTIIGDFDEAKELMTGLSNFFGGIIEKFSNNRNSVLEGALSTKLFSGDPFAKLSERIAKVTGATDKLAEATEKVTDVTKNYGEVVDRIIGGEFGNGQERFDKLAEAGYDWAHAQNLVNEKLGDGTRHATDYKEAQDELAESQERVSEAQQVTIDDLVKMSDAQLKTLGFTKDEIEAFRELEKQSQKTGIPIQDLVNDLDQLNGRTLLINSFKNAGQGLVTVFQSIGKAWKEAFYGDMSDEDILALKAERLYDVIAALHKFSLALKVSDETADKITRTFKGLFAAIDILTTILGGGFKLGFKVLSKLLGAFNTDILSVTAGMGDAIVAFRDFLFDNKLVDAGFEMLANGIVKAIEAIRKFISFVGQLPMVQNFIESIKNGFNDIKNIDLSEVGKNIIQGLQNGLGDGVSGIFSKMIEIGKGIIEAIKGVLGIHSPSTVMMAIGGFIIAGLAIGLKAAFPEVWDAIVQLGADFVSRCQETFTSISWGKVFAGGLTAGMVYFMKKIADAVGGIGDAFDGLADMFVGGGKVLLSFNKVLKGLAFDLKAKGLQRLAISIAILAGVIIALSFIETDKAWEAVGVVAALAGILVALGAAMELMSAASVKIGRDGVKVGGIKTGLIAVGAALLMMAATVKIVGSMNPEQAKQGFMGLAGMMTAIAAVFGGLILISKFGDSDSIGKVSGMLIKLSVSLLLMAALCKLVGKLTPGEMLKGLAFTVVFTAFVTALCFVSKYAGDQADKIGSMVLKLSVAMLLMVGVCKLVGMLKASEMLKGALFAGGFLVFVGALVLISKLFPEAQIQKISGLVLSISVSLLLMVGVCKLAGMLKPSDMIKGALFAGAFLLMVYALVQIVSIGNDQQIAKVAGTILAMSVAIGILAAVAIVLGFVDLAGLAKGLIAVTLLGGVMTAMIWATRGAEDVKGSIMAMAVAIGVMAAAVVILSMIDPAKLAGATIALATLMGMFALMSKAASSIQSSLGSLAIMVLAVGMLAGVLYLLSGLPIDQTLGIAASLSLLMLSLSASMLIISKAGVISPIAIVAIGAMTLVVAALAVILGILGSLNIGSTLEIAISLSVLLLALSGACVILAGVGAFGPAAFIGIGALVTLITALGALMVAIGALVTYVPQVEEFLDKGIPILEKIGHALGSFVGNIITGFAEGAMSGLPKIGTMLSEFMSNATPFLEGAKTIDESSMTGVKTMAEAIMLLTGANILDSITSFLTGGSSLSDFAEQLVPFGEAIKAFGVAVAGVDGESIEAAAKAGKYLAETASALPNSGGWLSKIVGDNDMGVFADGLVSFGEALKGYGDAVAGVDGESIEASASAAESLVDVANAIPNSGGWLSKIVGDNDMSVFAEGLVSFGEAMTDYCTAIAGVDPAAIETSVSAANSLVKVANSLENTGGFVSLFTGDNDLATFGNTLEPFGEAMKAYGDTVAGLDPEAIEVSVSAAKSLVKIANSLEAVGGLNTLFDGSADLISFGNTLAPFGEGMKKYGEAVAGIDPEAIDASVKGAKGLVKVANSLSETGGLEGLLDGNKNLGAFGRTLKPFGEGMKEYGTSVAGLDANAVSNSVPAAKSLVKVAKLISESESFSGLGSLVTSFKLDSFGKSLKTYSDSVLGLDAAGIEASVSAAKSIVDLIKSTAGLDSSGVSAFVTSINTFGKANVSQFVTAFTSASPDMMAAGKKMMTELLKGLKSQNGDIKSAAKSVVDDILKAIRNKNSEFNKAGKDIMTKFANGIKDKSSAVKNAATATLNSAVSRLRSYYSNFYNAGSYVASGFANGIRANIKSAANAAASMASAASSAARANLQINSPSKVFMRIGGSVPEGFAKGITKYGSYVDNSIGRMAKSALNGTKMAISRIGDAINSDIDAQPTIRPVLDLSAVQAGAGAVNGLFDKPLSIGTKANINGLAAMSNKNLQNGDNSDVISAIDRLGKKLSNIGGPSYAINGVTYDDGSNIAAAVKSIVRAAKVERRI